MLMGEFKSLGLNSTNLPSAQIAAGGRNLTGNCGSPTLSAMELQIPDRQAAELADLAARTGRNASDLVVEAVDRLLAQEKWFEEQVRTGIDQIARGEFFEEETMDARVGRMLER
jgi:predicted transcriptional regulator